MNFQIQIMVGLLRLSANDIRKRVGWQPCRRLFPSTSPLLQDRLLQHHPPLSPLPSKFIVIPLTDSESEELFSPLPVPRRIPANNRPDQTTISSHRDCLPGQLQVPARAVEEVMRSRREQQVDDSRLKDHRQNLIERLLDRRKECDRGRREGKTVPSLGKSLRSELLEVVCRFGYKGRCQHQGRCYDVPQIKRTVKLRSKKRNRRYRQKFCSVCKAEGDLIPCGSCYKAFHICCLDPELEKMPKGKQNCLGCQGK